MSLHDRDYMRAGPRTFGAWLRGLSAFHAVFALNVAVFVVQWVFEEAWLRDALTGAPVRPLGGVSVDELIAGHFWTPFTQMFVHGGWGAFVGNMLLLWFAGRRVADIYGGRNFVLVYLLGGLVGAAVDLAMAAYVMKITSLPLMGAAGPVLGLLMAAAVALPEEQMPVVPISLRTFANGLMLVNVVLALLSLAGPLPYWPEGDVAYFAHLGGGLAGWYFARSLGYGGVPAHLLRSRRSASPLPRRRPAMARTQRPRRPVVDVDMEAVRRENPRNDPLVDLMKDEIDPILDKINDQGMGSLTNDERRALERASRRLSK